MPGSLGFVVGGFCSAISCLLLSIAIADGRSLCHITDGARTGDSVTDYAAFGIWKDYLGHSWINDLNFVDGCTELKDIAQALAAFSMMPAILFGFSVIVCLLGLKNGGGAMGTVSAALNGVNILFLIIAIGLAAGMYDDTHCSWRMKDTYDLSYAIAFFVLSLVLALISIGALVSMGAMGSAPPAETTEEVTEAKEAAPEGEKEAAA